MKKQFLPFIISLGFIFASMSFAAYVLRKDGKIYIEDQTGERWDVTQANSLGFKPEWFQYGIGKNAFTPLDDSHLENDNSSGLKNPRVIGIAEGSEAQAYSVPKLRYHEIANTRIGGRQIAVGY
jgi:hypothetical protein